ncbi:MAG: hypothetical protein ABSH20_06335 [Tepidisphaeraceae bacterium]|jgi:hypothetical protein
MTYVPDYMTPQPQPPGRGGLMAFGIISILIGAMAGCMSLAMPLTLAASKVAPAGAPALTIGSVVTALMFYIVIAVGFIWTGIGSCQCRRWVRPLILCIAWPWLVMGSLAGIMVVPMMRDMPLPATPGAPAQARTIVLVVGGVVMAIVYIAIPLAYICFYQRRSVRTTLNLCDPRPRWTERCPMPVLGLGIWLLIFGLGSISMLQYRCVPLFGTYVTGLPAAGLILGLAAAIVFAAWACYHQRPAGWWIALLAILGWAVSALLTFHFVGIMEFYRHSGLPRDQMALLEQQPVLHGHLPMLMAAVFGTVCTAYLLYVRRYFASPRPADRNAILDNPHRSLSPTNSAHNP